MEAGFSGKSPASGWSGYRIIIIFEIEEQIRVLYTCNAKILDFGFTLICGLRANAEQREPSSLRILATVGRRRGSLISPFTENGSRGVNEPEIFKYLCPRVLACIVQSCASLALSLPRGVSSADAI